MSALTSELIGAMDRIGVARRIGHALAVTISGLDCTDQQASDGAVDIVRVMLSDLDTATDELKAILSALSESKGKAA